MATPFAALPSSIRSTPVPFKVHIPQEQLDDFKMLLKLSKLGPRTYENQQEDGRYGVTHYWLSKAKAEWETFDW